MIQDVRTRAQRRVGIIQSSYIPWRGYFDFIRSVDVFVIFDEVRYPQGRSWRNRNQVKTAQGLKWLTVPVKAGAHHLRINQVQIGHAEKPWQAVHREFLAQSLDLCPHFTDASAIWEAAVAAGDMMISDLNVRLIRSLCSHLNIQTPIILDRDLKAEGSKTARLISLVRQVQGTIYVSGPAAKDYLEVELFRQAGIRLEFKTYDYRPYPQLWGEFVGTVTILDLIANVGPAACKYLESRTSNEVAVP